VLAFGADPLGWSIDAVAGPLVVGWIGLTIVAAATHLLPAVGPGDAAVHARQRQLLGRVATARLAVLDGGVAALAIGLPLGWTSLVMGGAFLAALGLGAAVALLAAAVMVGVRRPSA
jgi:hypothetical protein